MGLAGIALVGFGAVARRRWSIWLGCAAAAGAVVIAASLLAVPAYPTTYFRSPVRYTAESVSRGASLFAQHCSVCHGRYGHGNGPAATALAIKPADLTQEHLLHRREGDLYWWLTHGIAGSPMPGFGNRTTETQRWDLLNFLRAQAEAERSKEMDTSVDYRRPVIAPELAQRGVRIVAVPLTPVVSVPAGKGRESLESTMFAVPDAALVTTYSLFARTALAGYASVTVRHVEFRIDRRGYLRARWIPGVVRDWDRIPELLQQIEILNHEASTPPSPEGHAHAY